MIENKRIKNYCNHYYLNQLRDSKVGLKLAIIGFALFIYADIFVFEYPIFVTKLRLSLIAYYTIALFCSYKFENRRKLLEVILTTSVFLSLLFGAFISVYMGHAMSEFYYRASQVYILMTIGSILFSGIVKPYLNYLIGVNLALYCIGSVLVYGFSVNVFYQNFNVIFLSLSCIVFNYYYIRSRVYEFEAIVEKNNRIEELKDEIAARQELQYQLKEMATYDGLTKAYTRVVGIGMVEKLMEKTNRDYKSISIIYLDVNGLKIINDTYGHKIGDKYIVGLVETINKFKRHHDFCIRLGGDEFLVVLPDTTYFEAEQIWRVMNVEVEAFEIEEEETSILLRVSHGIAEYNDNNYPSIEYFLDAADDKMYKEKKISKMNEAKSM